ncbi:MAG: Zn-ribbon domain-containing OB-fold protein [Candidatus Binatia bacterium]
MSDYLKPIPVPSEESEPYWAGAKRHELCLQRCQDCGAFRLPPAPLCPECTALGGEWTKVSGQGKIYSFVIFHRAYHKAFEKDLPYAVAVIELAEGPRLLSNIVGIAPDQIRCDMPVEVTFEDITPDATLPRFRPIP